jgi:hypothetical protein
MSKRRARVSLEAISGLLLMQPEHEIASQALQSALQATHAVWKGTSAAHNAVALANHALRSLRWRFLGGLGLKLAVLVLLIFIGLWSVSVSNRSGPRRIEKLGQAWGALDRRVAQHRQYLMTTPPNTPGYQARIQEDLAAISGESSGVISQLNPLLAPPDERAHFANFLTAELAKTLNLDRSQKAALFVYIQKRLASGATLNDAMKNLAETTPTEASEIRAMLLPTQRQLFDQIYGADGVLLFSYAKVVALGRIGP